MSACDDVLQRGDHRAQLHADQLLEQRLLVGEVQIDRALGDPGAPRHVVEPGRGKAAGGELVERRRQDGVAPLGAARGTGACRGRRGSARALASEVSESRPALPGFAGLAICSVK